MSITKCLICNSSDIVPCNDSTAFWRTLVACKSCGEVYWVHEAEDKAEVTMIHREVKGPPDIIVKEITKNVNSTLEAMHQAGLIRIEKISDGYHTFKDLYDHRIALFIRLCIEKSEHAWKALRNANGSEWPGWFILGLYTEKGEQITYHIPMKYWDMIPCKEHEIDPYYDGHSSKDIIKRLLNGHKQTTSTESTVDERLSGQK